MTSETRVKRGVFKRRVNQVYKFTKIAVSFLLILSIILNPLASAFDIRARAISPIVIEGAKWVITKLIEIVGGSVAVYLGSEAVAATDEAMQEAQRNQASALNALEKGVGVELTPSVVDEYGNYHDAYYSASLIDNSELTDEEKEFAQYFVNYVNSNPDEFAVTLEKQEDGSYKFQLTPEQYENMKNSVSESYNEWVFDKIAKNTNDSNVVSMVENGVVPIYNFSFVGPQPFLSAPLMTGQATLMKDGFVLSVPISSTVLNENGRLPTYEMAETYGRYFTDYTVGGNDVSGYSFTAKTSCYSGGFYILYDGILYYKVNFPYSDSFFERSFIFAMPNSVMYST